MKKVVEIYSERVPESYESTISIIIRSKKSEFNIEYDLVCALLDASEEHPQLNNIKIVDKRS